MKSSTEVEGLLQEVDQCRVFLTKLLKDLRAAREGDEWDAVALARTLESAEKAPPLGADLGSMIASTRSKVERDASTAILELEADLRDVCARRSWRVDGQWPKLYLERAIEFEVDEKRRSISIGGLKLKSFASKAIERALDKEVKELIPRGFDPQKFMGQLSRAYDEASAGKGGETPLLRVYREMVLLSQSSKLWRNARARSFAEFTASQFRARLSAALESGARSDPDGRELRLLPPIDPKDAMFVYQPAERRFGFVGRIEFRSTGEGVA